MNIPNFRQYFLFESRRDLPPYIIKFIEKIARQAPNSTVMIPGPGGRTMYEDLGRITVETYAGKKIKVLVRMEGYNSEINGVYTSPPAIITIYGNFVRRRGISGVESLLVHEFTHVLQHDQDSSSTPEDGVDNYYANPLEIEAYLATIRFEIKTRFKNILRGDNPQRQISYFFKSLYDFCRQPMEETLNRRTYPKFLSHYSEFLKHASSGKTLKKIKTVIWHTVNELETIVNEY